jgi:hypothetical protein
LQRENLYNVIDDLEVKLEPILARIEKTFKDVISYNGRSYAEKMKYDRLEMLHYLTEERRMKYFKSEVRSKHLKTNIIELKG